MIKITKTAKSNTKVKESQQKRAAIKSLPHYHKCLQLILSACYILGLFSCVENTSAQTRSANNLLQSSQETLQDVNVPNTEPLISEKQKSQASSLGPENIANQTKKFSALKNQKSNSEIAHQLWLNRLTPPKKQDDTKYKKELQQLIKLIRSVKFESKDKPAEPVIAIEPTKKAEPNETITIIKQAQADEVGFDQVQPFALAAEQKTQSTTDKSLPYKPVSVETLQMLHKLSTKPEQMHNHLELAEILFLSSHLKEAAIFYKHALKQMSQDDLISAKDKAWIIFQIANCLRDEDQQAAKKIYRQLINEYPNSLWTDLAKARERLIDWYLTDKPLTLIDENGS